MIKLEISVTRSSQSVNSIENSLSMVEAVSEAGHEAVEEQITLDVVGMHRGPYEKRAQNTLLGVNRVLGAAHRQAM